MIDIVDPIAPDGHRDTAAIGETDYETFLAGGDPQYAWAPPEDEWQSLALNYTSGTTGNPKGVVYHHRGAYLNALGNALAFGLRSDSVYLWTLPMFHCNGWCYPWAVTAAGATHVCLRGIDAGRIFALIEQHRVTHLCGAPIVLNTLVHAPERPRAALRLEGRSGNRRRCASDRGDRAHGRDGLPRDASLWAHGDVRAGDAVRVAARLGRPPACGTRALHGAPGRRDADAERGHGARARHESPRPLRTAARSARSACAAIR